MLAPAGAERHRLRGHGGSLAAGDAPNCYRSTRRVIDGGDYGGARPASLAGSPISATSSDAAGIRASSTEVVDVVQRLIHRQIDAGHGNEGIRPHHRGDAGVRHERDGSGTRADGPGLRHRRAAGRELPHHACGIGPQPRPTCCWPAGRAAAPGAAEAVTAADLTLINVVDHEAVDAILGSGGHRRRGQDHRGLEFRHPRAGLGGPQPWWPTSAGAISTAPS